MHKWMKGNVWRIKNVKWVSVKPEKTSWNFWNILWNISWNISRQKNSWNFTSLVITRDGNLCVCVCVRVYVCVRVACSRRRTFRLRCVYNGRASSEYTAHVCGTSHFLWASSASSFTVLSAAAAATVTRRQCRYASHSRRVIQCSGSLPNKCYWFTDLFIITNFWLLLFFFPGNVDIDDDITKTFRWQ